MDFSEMTLFAKRPPFPNPSQDFPWRCTFTYTGADASGCSTGKKKTALVLGNAREFPETITSTGALPFSTVLVVFQAPICGGAREPLQQVGPS